MTMRSSLFLAMMMASVIGLAALGCGSSDSSSGAGGGAATGATLPGVGEKKSVAIKASAGGTLTATGGGIDIPAGALAADTTITVEIKDKSAFSGADAVAVNVFDFGPNGTTFLKPVAMTLDLQGVAVPSGKTAKLAYYEGAAWKTLDDSKLEGGKVTATTTHFTPFTIVFVGGSQTQGGCDAFAGFTPCGGDLTGTWTFDAACVQIAPDPKWSNCQGAGFSGSLDQTGSISFAAGDTYSLNGNQAVALTGVYPKACLGPGQTCQSAFGGSNATVTETPTECDLSLKKTDTMNESGTFTQANGSFTLTKSGSSAGSPIAYCVSGNTLTAKNVDNGNVFFYTATK